MALSFPANPTDGQQYSLTDTRGKTKTYKYNSSKGVWRLARGTDAVNVSDLTTAVAESLTVTWNDVTGKPTLAAVATSGSYDSLTGKPTLAAVATSGSYDSLTDKPIDGAYTISVVSALPGVPDVNTIYIVTG